MLHITNGDIAAELLSRLFEGDVLPWRDVLHEGPVRAGLALERLSEERARFIAECGWGSLAEVQATFRERDSALRGSLSQEEIVLWFEHDLYDQLQLLQVLDWFRRHPHPRLSLICEAEYLSEMPPERMRALFAARKEVTTAQLEDGSSAWVAFTGPDPAKMPTAQSGLRFVGAALRRHLQEFPWREDELSLLERRVLASLEQGPLDFVDLFRRVREDPVFLGDIVFQWHLQRMQEEGLIELRGDLWGFKSRKRSRRVPRWLGGVCVDASCPWRWDPKLNGVRPYLPE